MSLDTATKRRSMFAMGVLALIVHPVPDATIAAIDQKHFLGLMAAVATTVGSFNIHKYSTGPVQPNHASDSGDNILVAGVVEAQGGGYFGGASDYIEMSSTGDIVFVGGAGLPFAEINVVSNAVETAIASSGAAVQVTIFNTNAPSNNATPDHTNDHITITKAGIYFITVSATINSVSGAASRLELTVLKNNGTALVGALHCDRNLGGGGSESGSVSISGLGTLSVNDTIEVWIENETNTQNYVVEDITLTLVQIGGT